jgi:hypothetical protein
MLANADDLICKSINAMRTDWWKSMKCDNICSLCVSKKMLKCKKKDDLTKEERQKLRMYPNDIASGVLDNNFWYCPFSYLLFFLIFPHLSIKTHPDDLTR